MIDQSRLLATRQQPRNSMTLGEIASPHGNATSNFSISNRNRDRNWITNECYLCLFVCLFVFVPIMRVVCWIDIQWQCNSFRRHCRTYKFRFILSLIWSNSSLRFLTTIIRRRRHRSNTPSQHEIWQRIRYRTWLNIVVVVVVVVV